jgi:hypothetical protein
MCNRDICYEHCRYDEDCWGDYPDKYCPICYKLKFVTYKLARREMEDKHDREVEKFEKKMKKESLEELNKKGK